MPGRPRLSRALTNARQSWSRLAAKVLGGPRWPAAGSPQVSALPPPACVIE